VIVSDAVIVIVGLTVVGAVVAGAVVAGAVVAGAVVAGAVVAGAVVAGAVVAGAVVAGAVVAGAVVAGAVVAGALVAGVVVFVPGVVGTVPDEETWGVGLTTGPTVVPVPVVGGFTRALMIGESPATVPDRLVEPPIAFGLPLELPLALAWAAAGDSPSSPGAAGQLAALQAMNALDDPDCDALVPYQQISAMAPRTPVPITRFRTECGRW
jgi:hypothetical protein